MTDDMETHPYIVHTRVVLGRNIALSLIDYLPLCVLFAPVPWGGPGKKSAGCTGPCTQNVQIHAVRAKIRTCFAEAELEWNNFHSSAADLYTAHRD